MSMAGYILKTLKKKRKKERTRAGYCHKKRHLQALDILVTP